MKERYKVGYCQGCGRSLGLVPADATDITCFKCDQAAPRKPKD